MPSEIDPSGITLGLILTAAGTVVASTIIASLIEILKRLGSVGAWIGDGREGSFAFLFSLILVGYAYIATTPEINPINAFAAFLAWLGVAGLATKAYDAGAAVKAAITG